MRFRFHVDASPQGKSRELRLASRVEEAAANNPAYRWSEDEKPTRVEAAVGPSKLVRLISRPRTFPPPLPTSLTARLFCVFLAPCLRQARHDAPSGVSSSARDATPPSTPPPPPPPQLAAADDALEEAPLATSILALLAELEAERRECARDAVVRWDSSSFSSFSYFARLPGPSPFACDACPHASPRPPLDANVCTFRCLLAQAAAREIAALHASQTDLEARLLRQTQRLERLPPPLLTPLLAHEDRGPAFGSTPASTALDSGNVSGPGPARGPNSDEPAQRGLPSNPQPGGTGNVGQILAPADDRRGPGPAGEGKDKLDSAIGAVLGWLAR